VAYACNPSYSGGIVRDQEDHGSKPAWQFVRPYLEKKPSQKKTDVAQGECPEFKLQYNKRKKVKRMSKWKMNHGLSHPVWDT
jgi:hypothetical protein